MPSTPNKSVKIKSNKAQQMSVTTQVFFKKKLNYNIFDYNS